MVNPPTALALVRAIKQLTAQIAHLASNSSQNVFELESQGQAAKLPATELPATIASIPGIEIIEVNAPQLYAKFCCQVCLREWIVPIPLERLDSYQPPKNCRWCHSVVWSNPERAQIRSDQRSKRTQALNRGLGAQGNDIIDTILQG